MMRQQVSVLGFMATRGLLAEFAATWDGNAVICSTGGVEAALLVREGKPVDVVVLAGAAMNKLVADGFILPGSLTGVAIFTVVAAIRTGETIPNLSIADGLCCTGSRPLRSGHLTVLLREANILWTSELKHPVQCVHGNRDLGRSPMIGAGLQPVPDDTFEAADVGFDQSPPVVASGLLLSHAAALGDDL